MLVDPVTTAHNSNENNTTIKPAS